LPDAKLHQSTDRHRRLALQMFNVGKGSRFAKFNKKKQPVPQIAAQTVNSTAALIVNS